MSLTDYIVLILSITSVIVNGQKIYDFLHDIVKKRIVKKKKDKSKIEPKIPNFKYPSQEEILKYG